MKRTVLTFLLILLSVFALSAKSNFYFSAGPEIGAEGLSIKNTSSLMKYYGGEVKFGVFTNPMLSFYVGAELNSASHMSSYSTFSSFRSGYCAAAYGGFGVYFYGLDLLFDAGIRSFNLGKETKNYFTMYNFGITPLFTMATGKGHAVKAAIPFDYAFNKEARFFSVGFSMIYEYGVRK